ncbi:MAG: hypothetical protein M1817_005932 [Caeruleum heppii]|nr:MAG: hypothetical protein M1817_005932 [Caeruleum heppii]
MASTKRYSSVLASNGRRSSSPADESRLHFRERAQNAHRNSNKAMSSSVDNLQDDFYRFKAFMAEMQRDRQPSTVSRDSVTLSRDEFDLLLNSMADVKRKTSEVDVMKMELEMMKHRLKRLEDGLIATQQQQQQQQQHHTAVASLDQEDDGYTTKKRKTQRDSSSEGRMLSKRRWPSDRDVPSPGPASRQRIREPSVELPSSIGLHMHDQHDRLLNSDDENGLDEDAAVESKDRDRGSRRRTQAQQAPQRNRPVGLRGHLGRGSLKQTGGRASLGSGGNRIPDDEDASSHDGSPEPAKARSASPKPTTTTTTTNTKPKGEDPAAQAKDSDVAARRRAPIPPPIFNDLGQRLRKDGSLDRRSFNSNTKKIRVSSSDGGGAASAKKKKQWKKKPTLDEMTVAEAKRSLDLAYPGTTTAKDKDRTDEEERRERDKLVTEAFEREALNGGS